MIRCALDEDGCIDLLAILRIMNQISQEQAWAIAYELAALTQRIWPAGNNCAIIDSLAQIYIHKEGFIHEKTLWTKITSHVSSDSALNNGQIKLANREQETRLDSQDNMQQENNLIQMQRNNSTTNSTTTGISPTTTATNTTSDTPLNTTNINTTTATTNTLPPTPPISPELSDEIHRRKIANSESELISSLGMALFWALDYGIPDDEERKLNIAMEYLIIQSQKEMTLGELEEICIRRLPVAKKSQADLHYREVCKSLVRDTIELSIFLHKIYTATMALNGVEGQHFHQLHQFQVAISNGTNRNDNDSRLSAGEDHDYLRIAHQLASEGSVTAANVPVKYKTKSTTAANLHHKDKTTDIDDHDPLIVKNCRNSVIMFKNHFVDGDELTDLGLPLDWARLWMQVIREFRQRGKIIVT